MTTDPNERLRLTLTGRDLSIPLSHADEKRLRMWIDRMNADEKRVMGDNAMPQDHDDDGVLVSALLACVETGLRADEAEHGLSVTPWGDVCSAEVAREAAR